MKTVLAFFLLLAAAYAFSKEGINFEEGNFPETLDAFTGAEFLQPRITGGQIAKPNEFPYQVGIYMTLPPMNIDEPKLHLWCGGSLISNEYVLTAAHCLYGMAEVVIILGAHNIQAKEQGRIVLPVKPDHFIIHPRYDPNRSQNDIALVKLPGKVPLSDKIKLIELPKRNNINLIVEGEMATSTGWGKMGDTVDMSNVLRFVQLKVLDNIVCRLNFPYTYSASKMLCVNGADKKSVCPGDSGGPLVIEKTKGSKTLIGLTSYGKKQCELGYPAVFTRVSAYLDWISEQTGMKV